MARTTQGRLFTRGKKKRYYLQYYLNGKQIVTALKDENGKPITSLREAERARDRIVAPYRAKNQVQKRRQAFDALTDASEHASRARKGKGLTLEEAWRKFESDPTRPQCGKAMLKDYCSRFSKFTSWMASNDRSISRMEEVTLEHAKKFASFLLESNLSANRYNKIIQGCRLVFRILAEQCNDMDNPFEKIQTKTLTTKSHRELSQDELANVCGSAEDELRVLFAIGIYTALRLGDACTLKWDAINFSNGHVVVVPRKTARSGKTIVIPLHPVLDAILKESPEDSRTGYVLPGIAQDYLKDRTKVSRKIQKHFVSCGIETQEQHEDQKKATCLVGFHSLRHSFVSICANSGVPLPVVQELCGHSSPAIQRHYIHIGRDITEAAIKALPTVHEPQQLPPRGERERLSALAFSLPIEKVKELLLVAEQLGSTGG